MAAGPEAGLPEGTAAVDGRIFSTSGANKRNIPQAIFIDAVEPLCTEFTWTLVGQRLQDLYSKYQYMQSSLTSQRASLKHKLPDITSALETVIHLTERRDKDDETKEYTYQLCENIFARAAVAKTNVVCLWLGANCMLEYTLDEARELLQTNESNAKTTLKSVEEDMSFLRDQLTTTEVNIARTHNHGVKLKQIQSAKDAEAAEGGVAQAGPPKPAPAARDGAGAAAFAPPPRAGGEGKGHVWKQQAEEIEISVLAPEGAAKGDIKVVITAESIKVKHKDTVLLEGSLAARCSPGGSTWTLEKGRVEVSLEKAEAKPWTSLFEDEE